MRFVVPILLLTVLAASAAQAAVVQSSRGTGVEPTLTRSFPGALLYVESVALDSGRAVVCAAAEHAASNPAVCAIVDALGLRGDGPLAGVQELLALSTGEFELVVPRIVDGIDDVTAGGMPPFVCRFRLAEDRAFQVAQDLDAERMTRPHRRVGDYQTHTMASTTPSSKARFEVALVAEDLFVGSDRPPGDSGPGDREATEQTPLERVLTLKSSPSTDTHSRPENSATSSLRPSQALRRNVRRRSPGSLTLSLDWKQLERRLEERCEHAGPWLERWFGFSSVDRITVQLTAERSRRGRPVDVHTAVWLQRDSKRPGGLLRASRKEPIRSLAAKLPPAGLGALVVAVDAARLAVLDSAASAPSPETTFRHDHDRELVEDGVASSEEEMTVETGDLYMRMHHDERFATFRIESSREIGASAESDREDPALLEAFDRISAVRDSAGRVFEKSEVDAVFRIDRVADTYRLAHAGAIAVADDHILIRMVNIVPN